MTAADRPSVTPRIGDQITTAEQLDALPLGTLVKDKHGDVAIHFTRGQWVFPETAGLGSKYVAKHYRPLTVEYVPGEQPRPSVTDDARAEAELRYADRPSDFTYPIEALLQQARAAFVKGAEWAAGRAETTADCGGCRGLGKHSPRCHTQPGHLWRRRADRAESLADEIGSNDAGMANRLYAVAGECRARAAGRAETTTATDEDAVTEVARLIDSCIPDDVPGYRHRYAVKAAEAMAARGLLATARTRPTETEQAVRAQLAAQYTARAAQARTTAAQFMWQQAARIARGGEDQ